MKKKILVLGAGVYQKPLILKAKEMGHTVFVVSPNGNYPGIEYADFFFDLDTTNSDAVLEVAKTNKVDAVITTGTDVCMPTLGKVVDALSLKGVSYETALKCMDKVLMKEAFNEFNVPTAKFKTFSRFQEGFIFAQKLGFPLMVKASDSSGSRGVFKVDSQNQFENAFNSALKVSRNKKIIVEEFLDGVEFGAQALISNGQLVKVVVHGDILNKGKITTPIGHYLPMDLEVPLLDKIDSVIRNAIIALEIDNCVSNIDFMLVNNEPKIIEIGARMGGTCLPENISIFYNENMYAYLIDLALGNNPIFTPNAFQANASLLLTSKKAGIIKSIIIPESVKNHPNLIEISIDMKVGDTVDVFEVGPDRLGHVITVGNTAKEACNLASKLASQIIFNLDKV